MARSPVLAPVKVYKGEGRLTVAALMPGVEPQDIDIVLNDMGELSMTSNRQGVFKGEKDVLLDEWNTGYQRTLALSDTVDGHGANVTYETACW